MKLTNYISLIAIALLTACSSPDVKETQETKTRPAKLLKVSKINTSRTLNFPAIIEADDTAQLTFQVEGQITSIDVLEGQKVKKGQVIARIEDRDYQNSYDESLAQFENAEKNYSRALELSQRGTVSKSVLDSRKTTLDIAKAVLDTSKKALDDTILKAPFSGFISKVMVDQFQNIQAKEAVANLQSNEVVAIVNVPAEIVARTPQVEPKNINIVLNSLPDISIPGELKEFSGEADPETQTYKVSVKFSAPDDLVILPGMTASVFADLELNNTSDIKADGISVPIASVVSEGNNVFVWRVNKETMQISKAPISTEMGMAENKVIVTSGLMKGDLIVAAGGSFLSDGIKVRAWQEK